MTEPSFAAEDMDAILDDALDELDDSDSDDNEETDNVAQDVSHPDVASSKATPTESKDKRNIPFGPPRPPPATPEKAGISKSTTTPNDPSGEDLQQVEESLRQMFQGLTTESQQATPEKAIDSKPTDSESTTPNANQSTVPSEEKMLQDLFQGLMAGGDPSGDVMPNMEDIPDLDNLFAGLGGGDASEGSGEAFNTDDFMEGMMEQLLSKELMYEPMKQVTEKFPEWLASKKDELPPEEWDQRNKQYDCFRRLVEAYEDDEGGKQTPKLLEIMQEVQEYGQPPPEIINEIAPGLDLDEEGLPKMNGGLPPFLGGNAGPEDCRIM
eukprot:CAMPEP_0116095768 /NCGR_PEP_ID=MMETSP0327-20121206/9838_1 /TAXON_ID=44447 /ORGANISM="Pseudo-nitzschia delicatissima, Strain B596" /LENGTH=323 /DNA_ID=CAMNT_0003587455 /DNA_START=85 /DNA_END=1056 /DNA_ORIENTATION=+